MAPVISYCPQELHLGGPSANPDASCAEISSTWSASGDYWTQTPHDPFGTLANVCTMSRDGFTLTVEDSGAQIYGSQLCANLAAAGFTDLSS